VTSASIGTVFFVGRIFYTIFYNTKEGAFNKIRGFGTGLGGLAVLAAFI